MNCSFCGWPAQTDPLRCERCKENLVEEDSMPTEYPSMPYVEFDAAAEALGLDLREPGWLTDAREALKRRREPGPHKYASARCSSGKRDYCTCDTCF